MTELWSIVLVGMLGLGQSEPPASPPEEKPPVKAPEGKAKPEAPAEGTPPPAIAPAERTRPPGPQAGARPGDPDRGPVSDQDLKALHENNIFSPKRVKRVKSTLTGEVATAPPVDLQTKPRPPLVTGFILDPKANCHLVVVEDRNGPKWKLFNEPKFLKAGEEVVGFHIDSVLKDRVTVHWGESSAELKVGEPLPDIGFKVPDPATPAPGATGPASEKAETPTLDEGTKSKVLEELRGRYKKTRRSSVDDP